VRAILDPRFTRRERQMGERVAALLWGLCAAGLAALAAWSA